MSDQKPTPETHEIQAYDYHACADYIEKKHGIQLRDYAVRPGEKDHFAAWCDARGYGKIDPDGKARGSSQRWFAEYNTDPNGVVKAPPHWDFWHWLVFTRHVTNGDCITLSYRDRERMVRWQIEILDLFLTEFGGDDEQVRLLIEW
jgi:hypothetical protein